MDEVDHLLTKERSVVYDLFEWPFLSTNVVIVIGIANSVDLIERSLPLLKIGQSMSCEGKSQIFPIDKKPKIMVFPSYTAADLSSIIRQRCDLCRQAIGQDIELFQPAAIEICSRKVVGLGF